MRASRRGPLAPGTGRGSGRRMRMGKSRQRRGVAGVVGGVLALLARIVLIVAGALFFVSAMIAALIASAVLLLWSLLTGRRPTLVPFPDGRWMFRARRAAPQPQAGRARRDMPGDVIDVEAREVRSGGREPPRDRTAGN
ncbi:hypothetical protein MOJ79_10045 [Calidifontimicrobium sp. SYSU G02091]|uniref:hypothetical protein n=1 Tax=Calidifontimicrobium sp. SYSU G02091 TaxID=2926421 RepID=UPI001F53261A|nr:hypothetical protein [Calidifontimicrobium sp. SYSU G02091]MCI1192183.1 hypothetical protein [Calidifontimicrobium sp. SYSU G02091]